MVTSRARKQLRPQTFSLQPLPNYICCGGVGCGVGC